MFFLDEDIDRLASPFKFSRIGKFSHGRPSISDISAAAFEAFWIKFGFQCQFIGS
ncbi:hypothetical protein LguiB_005819 [Lonicera macranthoides]